MDCKTATEYINIFDALSKDEKDSVLEHAQNCEQCKSELINALKLKDALGELDEFEAPAGLVQSAIKKAKKKNKIPPITYISVAVAAVAAIAFVVSSDMLNFGGMTGEKAAPMEMAAEEEMVRTNDEFSAAAEAPAAEEAMEAPVEEEAMEEPAADAVYEDTEEQSAEQEGAPLAAAKSDDLFIISVPADLKEFSQELDTFLTEGEIYVEQTLIDGNITLTFVVGELHFDSFNALLEQWQIVYEGSLYPGDLIEVTFEK